MRSPPSVRAAGMRSGSTPRAISAIRSCTAASSRRWALIVRMMPARIQPATATIGTANTIIGAITDSSVQHMVGS